MGCNTSRVNNNKIAATYEATGKEEVSAVGTASKEGSTVGRPKSAASSGKGNPNRRSVTETKINQALLKKKMEHVVSEKPISFEKILLKFDKLRTVLGYVKLIFNEVATNGKLGHDGLQAAMKRLDVNMSLEDILDLFDFIDVRETNMITIKEFLTALTIGMVLDVIPALSAPPPSEAQTQANGKPIMRRSFSGLLGHNGEIKEMLNLIVSAYLMFDTEGKGYIVRSSVEKMLDEHGKKGSKNAMLSQQRWNEMVSVCFYFKAYDINCLCVFMNYERTGMRMEQ